MGALCFQGDTKMAKRLIHKVTSLDNGKTVKVYRDSEWDEYSCVLVGNPDATYYTKDKEDALDTAECMVN